MSAALQKFLKKSFDIREGEARRAILMQLNFFLIISTLLIVKPTVTGLFLSEIGIKQLPFTFLLVAIFALAISTIYSRFLGQVRLIRIILLTLSISILLFILFGCLLSLEIRGKWILYAFYIWVAIFGVLTASQFWILANIVFNIREAKRLFGFIGAGAIAGGIFGGFFTTLTAEWIGSEQLPFIGAGLLLICIPITLSIWTKNVLPTQSRFQITKKIATTNHPFQLIRKSPHLKYLAFIIGTSVIVARLVDYQFNAMASAAIEDPDELTAFLGFWFSFINVISLLIQLLLTRRVVGILGVGSSLFFLPISILFWASLLIFFPELWVAIIIKMSDGSLKQSINKAAVELLSLPIPREIKNKTKTFIDVVVDSLATGIGGLILIFLVNGFQLSFQFISIIIILLVGAWLYFVVRIRTTYLNAFKLNFQKVTHQEESHLDLKNHSIVRDLKYILASEDENQILYVLRKLKTQPDPRFAQHFIQLLEHPSEQVVEEAIRNLYFLKNQPVLEKIRDLVKHSSQEVKIAAFNYLFCHSKNDHLAEISHSLSDVDSRIRLAALISLAEESRDNPVLKGKFQLADRLQGQWQKLEELEKEDERTFQKISLLKALGLAKIPDFFPYIVSFMKDEEKTVAEQAILSAGKSVHPYFLPLLINSLKDPHLGEYAQRALSEYGAGIITVLIDFSQKPGAEKSILREFPKILEVFGTQVSVDFLFRLLKAGDAPLRLSALQSLNRLKSKFPFLNYYENEILPHLLNEARLYQDTLSILYIQRKKPEAFLKDEKKEARQHLIHLLESRLDNNLERIFRLLGLKYPPDDVIPLYENLHNLQSDLRINALEYLDNLLEPGLKKVLIPIVESALLDTISEEVVRNLNLKMPDEESFYQLLMEIGDEEIIKAITPFLTFKK